MNVYFISDVRFQASEWMVKNIPSNAYILQETANVIDLPVFPSRSTIHDPWYTNISFNFYDLDSDRKLQEELKLHISKADYIIVPSRRVFKNHPKDKYSLLSRYYEELFSGKSGFKQVAEFKVLNDENAEETWTVFDHPVIRIFKRVSII